MNQQNRWVLLILFSMLVLFLPIYFLPQPPASPPTPQDQATAESRSPSPEASLQGSKLSTSAPKNGFFKPVAKTIPLKEITIETDEYKATFSNQGAVLTGFQLKKYLNRQIKKPIQLVNADPAHPKPFSLDYVPLPDLNQKFFEVEGSSKKLSKSEDKAQVTFRYVNTNGIVLEKTFAFKNGSYLVSFDVTVSQKGRGTLETSNLIVEWPDTLGKAENTGDTQSRVQGYHVATLSSDHVSTEDRKKAQESVEIPAPISWTALANQFFVAALIPDPSTGGASVKVLRDFNDYLPPTEENPNPGPNLKLFTPRPLLVFPGKDLRSGESFQRKGQAFIGPQDYALLKTLNLQLEKVIDFGYYGWFDFLSVNMLKLLQWFFTWSRNWGLAIILLSLVVKLALWWPTHNSYKNMYQMQQKTKELQPKLEAIKRKYVDDKQEQQKQTMALYQQAGINPMGGCLPMLFQMPVFFALYATLSHSIELRGASFLWLGDLTLMDPLHVFPLLMGATMIIQQKVSGQMATQAAGQQKVMMWMMPVILTFMSFKWPSGLLVYWVVTNLLSMIQQKIVNREIQKAKKKVEA